MGITAYLIVIMLAAGDVYERVYEFESVPACHAALKAGKELLDKTANPPIMFCSTRPRNPPAAAPGASARRARA